jgi:hypothetical protein
MDHLSRVRVSQAPRFGAARLGALVGPGALALNLSLAGIPLLAGVATFGAAIVAAGQAQAQIGIDVTIAPPALPVYEQPPLPGPGYIWTPGYWAWGDDGYFWVPGTWVEPPQVGLLWTPGYWGWNGGHYLFNAGYWGPTVGFYGGIDYGFGYGGLGYEGGFWRGGEFSYNRTVNNFGGVHITNVYEKTVIHNTTTNRVSFNGPGGVVRRPEAAELAAARAPHVQPTPVQQQHLQMARQEPTLRASANHGQPPITATSRPGALHEAPAAGGAAHPAPEAGEHRGATPPLAEHGTTPHPMAPHATHPMAPHPMTPSHPMAPHPLASHPMTPAHSMAPRPMAPHPMESRPMAPRAASCSAGAAPGGQARTAAVMVGGPVSPLAVL